MVGWAAGESVYKGLLAVGGREKRERREVGRMGPMGLIGLMGHEAA